MPDQPSAAGGRRGREAAPALRPDVFRRRMPPAGRVRSHVSARVAARAEMCYP